MDKDRVSLIVGKLKGSKDPKEAPKMESENEDEMGLDTAVDEMIMAFENKDREKLKAALKSFIEMC